jgi:hypothetical protein
MKQVIEDIENDIENNKRQRHDAFGVKFDRIFDDKKLMDLFVSKLQPTMKKNFDESCLEL